MVHAVHSKMYGTEMYIKNSCICCFWLFRSRDCILCVNFRIWALLFANRECYRACLSLCGNLLSNALLSQIILQTDAYRMLIASALIVFKRSRDSIIHLPPVCSIPGIVVSTINSIYSAISLQIALKRIRDSDYQLYSKCNTNAVW